MSGKEVLPQWHFEEWAEKLRREWCKNCQKRNSLKNKAHESTFQDAPLLLLEPRGELLVLCRSALPTPCRHGRDVGFEALFICPIRTRSEFD